MSSLKSNKSCSFVAEQSSKTSDSLVAEVLASVPSYATSYSVGNSNNSSASSSAEASESINQSESSSTEDMSEVVDIDCMWLDYGLDCNEDAEITEEDLMELTSEIPDDYTYDYTDENESYDSGVSHTFSPSKEYPNFSMILSYLDKKLPNVLLILIIILSYNSTHYMKDGSSLLLNIGLIPLTLYFFLVTVYYDNLDKEDKNDMVKYMITSIITSILLFYYSSFLGFNLDNILHSADIEFSSLQGVILSFIKFVYKVLFLTSLILLSLVSLKSLRTLKNDE